MIVYSLEKNAGFFSEIFFMLNYYLIAKRYSMPFSLYTENWLFKYEKGWHDYFNSLNEFKNDTYSILAPQRIPEEINFCNNIDFNLTDYKNIIFEIFKLNDSLLNKYKEVLKLFNLHDYHAIFVRRGDKMIQESIYIPTSKYIDILLEKDNTVKTIFIQTDDYNVYLEANHYINSLKLDIKLYTTCPLLKRGVHMFNVNAKGSSVSKENDNYIKNLDKNTKPILNYTKDEIYEHTIEMLIGLEICKHSKYLCLDLQSNVSRYLLLSHDNSNSVIDVQNTVLDFNKPVLCPAIGIKYKN